MNKQQKAAIKHPCEFAEQCCHQRYHRTVKYGQDWFTTMLTVNVGHE
ncbi:MAG: hypothetical protein AAF542_17770 [Pseudomonadota bacterium]